MKIKLNNASQKLEHCMYLINPQKRLEIVAIIMRVMVMVVVVIFLKKLWKSHKELI